MLMEDKEKKQVLIEDGTASNFGIKNKAEVILKDKDYREMKDNNND